MILIVHFGAQYAQLIRRAVNELGVQATIVSPVDITTTRPTDVKGVVFSGGPASVNDDACACLRAVLPWQTPILGICFGHQVLVAALCGTVARQFSREYGKAALTLAAPSPLTADLPLVSTVWMSHGDTVRKLPPGLWEVIGVTHDGQHAAIANEVSRLYGVQFHPEVSQTEYGKQLMRNFVVNICAAPQDFTTADLAAELIAAVRERAGFDTHVLVGCSLGVDSTTTAVLCTQALGRDRVHPVFIDNGLQRDEDLLLARRAATFLPNLRVVEVQERFLHPLQSVSDPEKKRQIVGRTFWEIFREIAEELSCHHSLGLYAQGTLAPDVIESGADSPAAAVIKTHHNLIAPPPDFPYQPFEPLRTFYKDQVRTLGRTLGVPEDILTKHPFPGPGLAVRVLGSVTPERVRVARTADAIFTAALRKDGHYDRVSQAFFVLGEDRAVGVRGDQRVYGWVGNLRAVTTRDFMTADVAPFPPEYLPAVADQIVNSVPEIARVTFDITRKPPGTVEWE